MATRSRIPPPPPAASRPTLASRMPPSSPTHLKLMHPSLFRPGNMHHSSVYPLNAMVVVYRLPRHPPFPAHITPIITQRSLRHQYHCFPLHEASWMLSTLTSRHARLYRILSTFCMLYYISIIFILFDNNTGQSLLGRHREDDERTSPHRLRR
ncbi:uncharacterized protein EV420DRAFT_692782 [Desarmillaria tabescens]|uniref:Uncharacterized protein n=1 Tax=Armillaria tabescens TaxID=1929756 RepID=A0AA39K045_ARMTA|nr:uncharacterized protein EV420DRAFT_692782 [Desarmillaria tabescens]KAK0452121.1 hypothetical protein EV420DRAFT_692782 [Desarmillaria tabescens]